MLEIWALCNEINVNGLNGLGEKECGYTVESLLFFGFTLLTKTAKRDKELCLNLIK